MPVESHKSRVSRVKSIVKSIVMLTDHYQYPGDIYSRHSRFTKIYFKHHLQSSIRETLLLWLQERRIKFTEETEATSKKSKTHSNSHTSNNTS